MRHTLKLQKTVRPAAPGLSKVLGDLEARVMRFVWDSGQPLPARAVHELVARTHRVRPLTVITVLNRLVRKGLVTRRKRNGLLHYEARIEEDDFMRVVSLSVVEGVLGLSPAHVASSFVDVLARQDPERLEELARLIRRKMRDRR